MRRIFETPLYPYRRSPDQSAPRPAHHQVIIVGAGPVGLAAALDLCRHGIPVVVLDENDRVSSGSRAICFAKRSLEILDRLGCSKPIHTKGVVWNLGKVFFRDRQVYQFNLLPEEGHAHPDFLNLQQYHLEHALVAQLHSLQAQGAPVEIRGRNRIKGLHATDTGVQLEAETPEGCYTLHADWLLACDGAQSSLRALMGLGVEGRAFLDNFLIADVVMRADFPTERWFWFDPPFNPGQSALLHKQPDDVWRVDLQLGADIDLEREKRPENVRSRLRAMLGEGVAFDLEWVSIYTFCCNRMERFRHNRVIFAGDSAHQVSPFGARGANSGLQDVDNLCWKLRLVIAGAAPESLLESYNDERIAAADENIRQSSRSTDFITPKSPASQLLRNAVLDLAEQHSFARPLVNSGRLSLPYVYDGSPLNSPDELDGPARTRPGAPCPDAPTKNGFLLPQLADRFTLLTIDTPAPARMQLCGIPITRLALSSRECRECRDDATDALRQRYLGDCPTAVYLIRPDQHIAARHARFDAQWLRAALCRAIGKEDCP
ncbi:MAG: FAD-dependent oxidoreductase [Rhodobacteraceae bacterium]|nr:FAD-dependent oxidoreductase [Paracoccaceae bacterium]